MTLLILAIVFLATAGTLVGVYLFVNRRELAATDSARSRLRGTIDRQQHAQASILRGTQVSGIPFLDTLLSGRNITESLGTALQRAGVKAQPGTFVLYLAISTAAGALFGTMASGTLMVVACTVAGAAVRMQATCSNQRRQWPNARAWGPPSPQDDECG